MIAVFLRTFRFLDPRGPRTKDLALSAGSYSFQKDGERHTTQCTSLYVPFFMSHTGKFGYVPDSRPLRTMALHECGASDYSAERKGDFHP